MRGGRSLTRFAAAIGAAGAVAGLTILLAGAAAPVTGKSPLDHYSKGELAAIERHSPLGKVPPDGSDGVASSAAAAQLGQYLFFDTAFSANRKVSCASCHQPAHAFTDGRRVGKGVGLDTRNTQTVLNAVYNHWFFWDGRTDSLWSQALQPPENPREIGSDRLAIAHGVAADAALSAAYQAVFGKLPPLADMKRFPTHARPDSDPHSPLAKAWRGMAPSDRIAIDRLYSNLGKAIEAYERKLVGPPAPFDTYVEGLRSGDEAEFAAIPAAAKRGLRLFVGAGHCDLCHSGPTFSDGQFHNLGLPLLPGEAPDRGRAAGIVEVKADIFNAAGPFADHPSTQAKQQLEFLPKPQTKLGAFKTPTLRNVALTAPYMHDGRFADLSEVMKFYAEGAAASHGRLVGKREATLNVVPHFTAAQQADLIAFLKTLTSPPLPQSLRKPPASP